MNPVTIGTIDENIHGNQVDDLELYTEVTESITFTLTI